MQDHPNKRTENPPLDAEDWDNAFEAYKGNPGAALMMGFNLMVLKDCIALDPLVAEEATRDRGFVPIHAIPRCMSRHVHQSRRRRPYGSGRRDAKEAGS